MPYGRGSGPDITGANAPMLTGKLQTLLDQASMRTRESSSLCGFVWSLSVWMWERFPVSVYTGSSHVRYKCYVNELDTLSAKQVFWRPYEEDCIPTELTSTIITSLHRYTRRNNRDISDWAAKHQTWIPMWNQRERSIEKEDRPHNDSAYEKYLVWEEWSKLVSEDPSATEGYHAFNMDVRQTGGSQVDYAPMHDELGREFLMCVNDANVALSHPPGGASSERTLRTTLEFKSRFHKWASMLSCHGAQFVDVFTGGTSRSSRARRRQLTIDDIEEEEEEETTQEHEVDIDAPQPSQPSQSSKKKTPRVARRKKLNSRLRSPEYSRKNFPKGMRYIEEEEEEEDIEEEEAEGEEESSEEEEEEVPTRKGKAAKRGRRK
ncbi:hypothetical protein D1007_47962 [Hordeum vulgare]|nr:hypothetical protein D1007_47962 [Hordeum vulgare]